LQRRTEPRCRIVDDETARQQRHEHHIQRTDEAGVWRPSLLQADLLQRIDADSTTPSSTPAHEQFACAAGSRFDNCARRSSSSISSTLVLRGFGHIGLRYQRRFYPRARVPGTPRNSRTL